MKVTPKLRHFHAFGCPTYVLDNALQSGQAAPKWRQCSRLGVYLGPSLNLARSVALVLNPRTDQVSPQFHVKFDDFFKTVQQKSTDLNAPEPEWKYLSGFAVQKGQPKSGIKGSLDSLLAPRQGPSMTNMTSVPPVGTIQPRTQHQDLQIPAMDEGNAATAAGQTLPAPVTVPLAPVPQMIQPSATAHQTRSGRVIHNTSRYDQRLTQRSQGLVAWEVLMDQDEREDIPMAYMQYAIQKALEDPIAFAASEDPDILYWDQAMKAHDWDKFIEAVGIKLDGHEKMGNYEPIPLGNFPKGTQS